MLKLSGMRILIVEDEYVIAQDLARYFSGLGAEILGPVPNVEQALEFTDRADAAVLDINLRDNTVFPVADRLLERDIPFVFFTGYEKSIIPHRLRHVAALTKPTDPTRIFEALYPQSDLRAQSADADIVALLPKLRLAARLLLLDGGAADRLVERTLKDAIGAVDKRPEGYSTEEWLNGLLRRAARSAARFLH